MLHSASQGTVAEGSASQALRVGRQDLRQRHKRHEMNEEHF